MSDVVSELSDRTGLEIVGAFAFGDTPELQDELLGFVQCGTKRATAGPVDELGGEGEPFPEPGFYWGLLDGRGAPQFVMQTVEVTRGRVAEVTPAFAWDEGEYDRTLESWLDGHRRYFRRQGVQEPDDLEVIFERFRVVWPDPDVQAWLTDGVRELRWNERGWLREVYTQRWGDTRVVSRDELHDITRLPGLVCERDGQRLGALTFRPRPDGEAECVSVDAFERGTGVGAALTEGITALGRREGWRRLWAVTTNDNTPALRAYQRLGWDLVALHRDATGRAGAIEAAIPDPGLDGIPIRSALELQIQLD